LDADPQSNRKVAWIGIAVLAAAAAAYLIWPLLRLPMQL